MDKMVNKTQLANELNCRPSYISKLIKNGVLNFKGNKTISLNDAMKQIEKNKDPARAYVRENNNKRYGKNELKEDDVSSKNIQEIEEKKETYQENVFLMSDEDFENYLISLPYSEAKSLKEKMAVYTQKIKIKVETGELVRKDVVIMDAARIAKGLVDNLSNIPERVSDVLANINSSHEVRKILLKEIEETLENFKRELKDL